MQLYTVRAAMAMDVAATLQAVAGIGYEEVEFAGYFEHSQARFGGCSTDSDSRRPVLTWLRG